MTPERKPSATLRATDPRRIGPYTIMSCLGSGGEGRVYFGSSARTGPVAIKVIRPRTDDRDPTCHTEFDHIRRVDAQRVAPAIAHGVFETTPYLVTAYLHGTSARSLPAGRMDDAQLWLVAAGAARAIAAVHAAGLIHCDVKPANVMVSATYVRLIDFGIARDVHDQPVQAPRVYCSRDWAAPEQLRAQPLTQAVDVFGWGALIAYLASGEPPFAAETEREWMTRVRSTEPDLDGLPSGLDPLVRAALDREPSRRPAAGDLAEACRRWDAGRMRSGPNSRPMVRG